MPQPYELLARLTPKGEVAGLSVRYTETVGGRVYELDPQPLAGVDDPAFAAFAAAFNSAAVTERDAAVKALRESASAKDQEHQAAIDALKADHAAEVAKLQAHIDALGGTDEAIRLKKEADRAAALKAKADAEAKLAELADAEAVK